MVEITEQCNCQWMVHQFGSIARNSFQQLGDLNEASRTGFAGSDLTVHDHVVGIERDSPAGRDFSNQASTARDLTIRPTLRLSLHLL